jgi:hypothetical protein
VGLTAGTTMPGSGREYGRTLRGAMFTPWFAVSIGFVIATALTLATPHPALTFPPSKTGRCADADCASPSATPSGPLPAIKQEIKLPGPRRDANVRPAGIKVEYELLPSQHGKFTAVILIVGHRSLGRWKLRFVLPGATIDTIMWARWRADGAGGVIVSGAPQPWPRSGGNEARIVVRGRGSPRWPTGCEFDNGSCTFLALAADPQHKPGSLRVGG